MVSCVKIGSKTARSQTPSRLRVPTDASLSGDLDGEALQHGLKGGAPDEKLSLCLRIDWQAIL